MANIFESDMPDLMIQGKSKGGKKFNTSDPLFKLAHNANLYIRWPGIENPNDSINKLIEAKSRTGELRNVYSMGGGNFFSNQKSVRLTICGKLHRICVSTQRFRLARYADAAILYFWKYRSTERQPEDSDFNTSLAIAQQLLAVPQALFHLQTLEKFLIDNGQIKTDAEKAVERKQHDFIRDMRVARKYLERARRYTRLLAELYSLDDPKQNAVAMVVANITASLEIFSSTIQSDAHSVLKQIGKELL